MSNPSDHRENRQVKDSGTAWSGPDCNCPADARFNFRVHQQGGHGMMSGPVTILLVDDDTVDTMAVKRAFRELKIANPVIEAHNGIEALERLRGENGYQKVSEPLLILLDLNMPRMGGIEFLQELRHDPSLRRNLVFVMTTSSADEDRRQAYEENIAGYFLKHGPKEGLLEAMRMLERYWQMIEFPK
jgi:CheY-like chemotaxis protein